MGVTMGTLTARLEERLRRTASAAKASEDQASDDRDARNMVIEEADQAGISIREIARITFLTPTHVQRIIIRATAARQAGTRA
jgi:hypothetical protein